MNAFSIVLFCLLLITSGSSQAQGGWRDSQLISTNSVGKATVGMTSTLLKKLYKSCSFESRKMSAYGGGAGSGSDVGLCVKFKGKELFVAGIEKGKIYTLVVLADDYKTSRGIRVGSTASELKAACPNANVSRNRVQTATSEDEETVWYVFNVLKPDLGNYGPAHEGGRYYPPVELKPVLATVNWIIVTGPLL